MHDYVFFLSTMHIRLDGGGEVKGSGEVHQFSEIEFGVRKKSIYDEGIIRVQLG